MEPGIAMLLVDDEKDLVMTRGDRPRHRDQDPPHGQPRDCRHPRARVGDRGDSPRRAHRRADSRYDRPRSSTRKHQKEYRGSRSQVRRRRDQGPEAVTAMAAPSSEGPAALLGEALLWSAEPCFVGRLHRHQLAAAKAPGPTLINLVKLDNIMHLTITPVLAVKDILLPNRPDGAFRKEKVISDATAPRARKVVSKVRSESRKARATANGPQRPGPPKAWFSLPAPTQTHLERMRQPMPQLQQADPQVLVTGSLRKSGFAQHERAR